jgi:nitrile hydratase accessory protein
MITSIPRELDLDTLPGLPRDEKGPTFGAPWEAEAFAMTITLQSRGVFTWREWSAALAAELRDAVARGEPDDGSHYYEHWLAALETLVAEKKVVPRAEMDRHVEKWDKAVEMTPHGQPIPPPELG